MRAILGVDAAWTEAEPSGVALLVDEGAEWTCRVVAPSYGSFVDACRGMPVDWSDTPRGVAPPVGDLLDAARVAAGCLPNVVAIDMPMSLVAFSERREADNKISREFGGRSCSAHSPSAVRPGPLGWDMSESFRRLGYQLATDSEQRRADRALLEVYPHTALLALLGVDERVRYKGSKASKYWPDVAARVRVERLLDVFGTIKRALEDTLGRLPLDLPSTARSLAGLKRYEDALDAIVSAWMGTLYLAGRATPLGDTSAAVWVPTDTIRAQKVACPLCSAVGTRPLVAATPCAVAFTDGFPVSPGHTLIVSRRHVGSLFDLADAERNAIWDLVPAVKAAIEQSHAPTGYNVGVNIGSDAGQTVDHVHLHMIPRYKGDVDDPRGGVRWVVPAKADYWSRRR